MTKIDNEVANALIRAKAESEKGIEDINRFKQQYADWINEFGEDIKNIDASPLKKKKEGKITRFFKKLFNTISYE